MKKIKPWEYQKGNKCSDFPDSTWGRCCTLHNKAYYYGGSKKDKIQADFRLYQCVKRNGHPIIAVIMWLGVTLFGGPHWPHGFRWNRGYNYWESLSYFDRKCKKKSKD